MRKFILFVIVLVFTSNAVASRVNFDPLGKCEIEGTIKSEKYIDEYNDPCLRNGDCPVGAFVPHRPAMYELSIEITSVSCIPGTDDTNSYEAQFRLDDENDIIIYQSDVKKGDLFEVGDKISGIVELKALRHKFTSYILTKKGGSADGKNLISNKEIMKAANNLFNQKYLSAKPYTNSDIVSSSISEIDGYLLSGNILNKNYDFAIQVLNHRNNLCAVCLIKPDQDNVFFLTKGQDCFRIWGKPESEEMLSKIKQTLVSSYYNRLDLIQIKNGKRITPDDKMKVKDFKDSLENETWSWKNHLMYYVRFEVKDKYPQALGCRIVGGELLFLQTGGLVYNKSIELCKD